MMGVSAAGYCALGALQGALTSLSAYDVGGCAASVAGIGLLTNLRCAARLGIYPSPNCA